MGERDHGWSLVTGASGFIGGALVRRLQAAGVDVRGIARSPTASPASEIVVADLSSGPLDPRLFDGIDTVYHLAAKTHDVTDAGNSEREYSRINVDGTRHLLEAISRHAVRRVVFVSSVKVLGEGGPEVLDETRDPHPTTPYGRSKLAAERLVFEQAEQRSFAAVCLRFPLVYGPGQRGNLTQMIASIDRGWFPPPPDNGNRRSMLHVENAVDALVLAGRHATAARQTYLVTDTDPYSTRQVYDWIREALGKKPVTWGTPEWVFRTLATAGDAFRRILGRRVGVDSEALQKLLGSAWYSPAKIVRDLGYAPLRDLHAAMPELVAHHRGGRPGRPR